MPPALPRSPLPIPALREALWDVFTRYFSFRNGGWRRVPPEARAPGGQESPSAAGWRALGQEVMALHEAYTMRRKGFAHEENPLLHHQAGYLLYFLPRNLFRVFHVLQGLPWAAGNAPHAVAPWLEEGAAAGHLRWLDLGCGPGSLSLAVLGWLASGATATRRPPPMQVVLVDQNRQLLALAEAALRAFAARALPDVALHVEIHAEGVEAFLAESGRDASFGLVGAGFTLNELNLLAPGRSSRRAQRFADPVRRLTAPGGLMLAVEAGTRRGYMNLIAVRDQWRPRPILYPCPHGGDCPMFNPRVTQWCHATVPLPRHFFFDDLLRKKAGIDFRMRELNLSALAVQNLDGGGAGAPFRGRSGRRIVSDPMPARGPAKGRKEGERIVLECGADGRLTETPAAPFGPRPRGLWLEEGP